MPHMQFFPNLFEKKLYNQTFMHAIPIFNLEGLLVCINNAIKQYVNEESCVKSNPNVGVLSGDAKVGVALEDGAPKLGVEMGT